jgi:L,D-transpeptidase-like protein
MRSSGWVFAGLVAAISASGVGVAHAAVLVEVDKSIQQMTVSVDGQTLYRWPVSTGRGVGKNYDTPNGTWKAFRMEKDHFSKEWDDAPMPNSIFFTKIGHAIHGSFDVKHMGQPASHGCVRLQPENAEKLYALVQKEGVLKTTVVISGDVMVAERRAAEQRAYANAKANGTTTTTARQVAPSQIAPSQGQYVSAQPAPAEPEFVGDPRYQYRGDAYQRRYTSGYDRGYVSGNPDAYRGGYADNYQPQQRRGFFLFGN